MIFIDRSGDFKAFSFIELLCCAGRHIHTIKEPTHYDVNTQSETQMVINKNGKQRQQHTKWENERNGRMNRSTHICSSQHIKRYANGEA